MFEVTDVGHNIRLNQEDMCFLGCAETLRSHVSANNEAEQC